MKYITCLMLMLSLFGCSPNPSREEKIKLYSDVLNEIVDDNYYTYCLMLGEEAERIDSNYYAGKIDSTTYFEIVDSLKFIRKSTLPKCVLDYANEFQIFTTGHELNDDIRFSMSEVLKDVFFTEHFSNTSVKSIIDTLSQSAELSAEDLIVSYLEIVPYVKRVNRPFGDGMGVFSFSKIYFNKEADKAILFYEFNCGPKCGTGRVVFLIKENNKWKVEKYGDVWNS